jgi:hypothetical protein
MKNFLFFFIAITILGSCSPKHYVATIKSGSYNNGIVRDTIIQANGIVHNDVDGDTYLKFLNDSTKSNPVELSMYQKQRVAFRISGFKPVFLLAPLAIPALPFILIFQLFKHKEYAYATVDKHFYKKKDYYTDNCNTGNCNNKTYNLSVLMEIQIRCKNDMIKDTITIHDDLPIGVKQNSYKVISGEDKVTQILHTSTIKNGQETHTYKIIGKGNVFKKRKTKIKIVQELTYNTLDMYYSKN